MSLSGSRALSRSDNNIRVVLLLNLGAYRLDSFLFIFFNDNITGKDKSSVLRVIFRLQSNDFSLPKALEKLFDWPNFNTIEFTWLVFHGYQV